MRDFWPYTVRLLLSLALFCVIFVGGGQHLFGLGTGLVAVMVWLQWTDREPDPKK